jgi:hypothetical protein
MTLDYQKIWNTMNSLESVTSKICSAREILDSAIDSLENHKLEKTETLLYAVDEYLQYYLEEFDRKFKDAWAETVTKVHQETIKIDDLRRSWDPPGMWDNKKDAVQFNIDPAGNEINFLNVGAGNTAYDYPANSLLTEDRISNFPEEQDDCMPPWGHSDMEALRYTDEELDAMCDNAAKENMDPFYSYYPHQSEELIIGNKPRDYYENVAPSATQRDIDKVVKWQLPVEEVENGDTGEQEYFITFPEDLLEAANLKVDDIVTWIDNGDGTYTLKHKTMSDTIAPHDPYKDEMIAAGYKMVDGVWTKVTESLEW